MAKSKQVVLTVSFLAAADLGRNLFVDYEGDIATAGAGAAGVVAEDTPAGEYAPVDMVGITIVTAGAAITATAGGTLVEVGTGGKAITKDTGTAVGVAMDSASADGDLIRVRLI